jgi:hypothetical protein
MLASKEEQSRYAADRKVGMAAMHREFHENDVPNRTFSP